MSNSDKKTDEEKGDEVLRRMLRTPPKPNKDKPNPEKEEAPDK